jgi:hypothetical protein
MLRILRVEKQGLQFHETEVSVMKDGKVFVERNDRRLFQYQFEDDVSMGVSRLARAQATAVMTSLPGNGPPQWPKTLRSWQAEGWYVRAGRSILAFTSENGLQPPTDVVELFGEIEKLPTDAPYENLERDVCLGFCYDPVAALGFEYANDRCYVSSDHQTHCQ